ncbi:MAG: zinc ribbon domain-containing protein [Tissierellia bacterium]|nr:zinc ribbon domain-containing protein [Tissierellia bacterium]
MASRSIRNHRIFYIFWGLGLVLLLFTWFGPVFDLHLIKVSPFDILMKADMVNDVNQYINLGSSSEIRLVILIVFVILQTIVMVSAFFVPKVERTGYDILVTILSVLLIVYMIILTIAVKSEMEAQSLDMFKGLLSATFRAFRKSIYMSIFVILGIFMSKSQKANELMGNVQPAKEKSYDFGRIKDVLGAGNKYVKDTIDTGNRYIKSNLSNLKIDGINKKIQEAKVQIGKEMVRLNISNGQLVTDLLHAIQEKEKDIEKKRKDLLAANDKKICGNCKSEIQLSSVYCTECGTKQEEFTPKDYNIPPEDIQRTIVRLESEADDLYEQLGAYGALHKKDMPESVNAYIDILENYEYERKEYEEKELENSGMILCKNCGETIDKNSKFCNYCGEKNTGNSTCSQCGETVKEGALFCSNCGNSLRSKDL